MSLFKKPAVKLTVDTSSMKDAPVEPPPSALKVRSSVQAGCMRGVSRAGDP